MDACDYVHGYVCASVSVSMGVLVFVRARVRGRARMYGYVCMCSYGIRNVLVYACCH